jgi:hypothetical protein
VNAPAAETDLQDILRVFYSECLRIKKMLRSAEHRKDIANKAKRFPRPGVKKRDREREIKNIIESEWRAQIFVNICDKSAVGPEIEAFMRLWLAKEVMKERPEPTVLTSQVTRYETAKRLSQDTMPGADEVNLLTKPDAFKKGGPGSLISELAGVIIGMEEELRIYAACEAATADDIALGVNTAFRRGQVSGEARAKADAEKIKAEMEKIKSTLRDILKAGYTEVSGAAYRRLRKFVPDVPKNPAKRFRR